jgi:hypothetical protein
MIRFTAKSVSCYPLVPSALLAALALMPLAPVPGLAQQGSSLQRQAAIEWPLEFKPLLQALRQAGYKLILSQPPIPGAYGATNIRKKIIWVAPITIDLGIARQALIHEAVHAAQACPKGKLRPIGWTLPLERVVDREVRGVLYRNYSHAKHEVEREAFAMQGHPKAFELVTAALKQRCR